MANLYRPYNNAVNHPSHYNSGNLETIDVIADLGWEKGFCLGNVIKYVSRAGRKSNVSEIEDLKKARWYLDRWISSAANLAAEAECGNQKKDGSE